MVNVKYKKHIIFAVYKNTDMCGLSWVFLYCHFFFFFEADSGSIVTVDEGIISGQAEAINCLR